MGWVTASQHPELGTMEWWFCSSNHISTSVPLKITVIKAYVSGCKRFIVRRPEENMVFWFVSLKLPSRAPSSVCLTSLHSSVTLLGTVLCTSTVSRSTRHSYSFALLLLHQILNVLGQAPSSGLGLFPEPSEQPGTGAWVYSMKDFTAAFKLTFLQHAFSRYS